MPFCKFDGCDSNKIENRDLGLCASHNLQRRKAERPAVVKVVKPIVKVSAAQAQKHSQQQKAYRVAELEEHCCVSCGATERLTHSHILTQKQFPQHANNPANLVLECQECHSEWENNKPLAAAKHASWQRKMNLMRVLEPEYFQQFKQKHSNLF